VIARLPKTSQRVPLHSSSAANRAIADETAASVARYASELDGIAGRLEELEHEWDVERTLEMNASSLAFIGVVLGWLFSPYFLIVPAVVTAFLFQHAVQGWCPPLPVLRRLGFRTMREIDTERFALKALRGDFADAAGRKRADTRADAALSGARGR
jgi:hypothetical protein